MSTPAPPATLLHQISGFALYAVAVVVFLLIVLSGVLALLHAVNFGALAPSLAELLVVFGLLYWATTLLPGPVKRLGKAAGRGLFGNGSKHKGHK